MSAYFEIARDKDGKYTFNFWAAGWLAAVLFIVLASALLYALVLR